MTASLFGKCTAALFTRMGESPGSPRRALHGFFLVRGLGGLTRLRAWRTRRTSSRAMKSAAIPKRPPVVLTPCLRRRYEGRSAVHRVCGRRAARTLARETAEGEASNGGE